MNIAKENPQLDVMIRRYSGDNPQSEAKEAPDAAQGPEAVPPAMLRRWSMGRCRWQRHDPRQQSRRQFDPRHGAEDGRQGDAARDRGGGPRAAGMARAHRQ